MLFDGITHATLSSISMYARIIRDIEHGYGQLDGGSNPIKCIVTEEQLAQLESKLLSTFKVFSESDEMFCSPRFDEITPTWHHLDPESLISYEKKSVQDINNIPEFIKRRTGSWQSTTEGGPVYSEKYYCDVITLENLYKAVKQLIDSTEFASISEELQNLTYGFFLWYNSKDREQNSHISNKTIREKRKQLEGTYFIQNDGMDKSIFQILTEIMKKGKATNALPFALNLLFFAKQRSIIRYPPQIILHIAVQDQIGIGEGIIVNQIVQL